MDVLRRAVTGVGGNGQAVITSDGQPPRTAGMTTFPGFWMSEIWAVDGHPALPPDGDPTVTMTKFIPDAGDIRVRIWSFPPATAARLDVDPAAFDKELATLFPGFEDTVDPDNPGMHITDTIDVNIVISGELVLRLDSGEEARFGPGDSIVQLGTQHAWANEQDQPCVVATVMVGARRTPREPR